MYNRMKCALACVLLNHNGTHIMHHQNNITQTDAVPAAVAVRLLVCWWRHEVRELIIQRDGGQAMRVLDGLEVSFRRPEALHINTHVHGILILLHQKQEFTAQIMVPAPAHATFQSTGAFVDRNRKPIHFTFQPTKEYNAANKLVTFSLAPKAPPLALGLGKLSAIPVFG